MALICLALAAFTLVARAGDDRLAQAKAALVSGDVTGALAALKELAVSLPEPAKATAVELLGLAYERDGAFTKARVQYELFLRNYPGSESAARVRERLKGAIAAEEAQAGNRKWASVGGAAKPGEKSAALTAAPKGDRQQLNSSLRSRLKLPVEKKDPYSWNWEKHGNFSQLYVRSDSFDDGHELTGSDLLSAGSLRATGENGFYRVTTEASGFNRIAVGVEQDDVPASISRFYADIVDKASGNSARIGRQSGNAHGISGTFDGVAVKVKSSPRLALGVTAGSPVYDREVLPFDEGRVFAGASITYVPEHVPLRGSIYAVEQDVKSVTDRRAIGFELDYEKGDVSAGAYADYDIYHKRMSGAGLDVQWQVNDRLSTYGSLEFQTVPFLLTSNALIGQAEDTLPAIRDLLGAEEVARLATGRTADAIIATAGASYVYSDQWTLSVDGYFADYGSTKSSGGVDATAHEAPDLYLALVANGSGIWRENDQLTLGARISDTASSTTVLGEAGYRWTVSDKLRMSSRLRSGVKRKTGGETAWLVMPDFGLRYKVSKNWSLQMDGGLRWQIQPGADQAELQFAAGYVFEF